MKIMMKKPPLVLDSANNDGNDADVDNNDDNDELDNTNMRKMMKKVAFQNYQERFCELHSQHD